MMDQKKIEELLMPTPKQQTEFKGAIRAGLVRDIAIMRGGTGELRKELTPKEYATLKRKRKQQKEARRRNRNK